MSMLKITSPNELIKLKILYSSHRENFVQQINSLVFVTTTSASKALNTDAVSDWKEKISFLCVIYVTNYIYTIFRCTGMLALYFCVICLFVMVWMMMNADNPKYLVTKTKHKYFFETEVTKHWNGRWRGWKKDNARQAHAELKAGCHERFNMSWILGVLSRL